MKHKISIEDTEFFTSVLENFHAVAFREAQALAIDPDILRPETEAAAEATSGATGVLVAAIDAYCADQLSCTLREAFLPHIGAGSAPSCSRTITASTAFYRALEGFQSTALRIGAQFPAYERASPAAQRELNGHVSALAELVDAYFASAEAVGPSSAGDDSGAGASSAAASVDEGSVLEILSAYRRALEAFRDTPRETEKIALEQAEEDLFALIDGDDGPIVRAALPAPAKSPDFGSNLTAAQVIEFSLNDLRLGDVLSQYGVAFSAYQDCRDEEGNKRPSAPEEALRDRYDCTQAAVMALVRSYGAKCFAEGQYRAVPN